MKIICFFSLMMILTLANSTLSQTDTRKWFSIYLLPKNVESNKLAKLDLKKLKPVGKPLIHQDDIFFYNRDKHQFTVYFEVFEKLRKLKLNQRPFAVFVGDEAIYAGAFWSSLSSQSFEGVIINPFNFEKESSSFRLELGYPTPKYFKGPDLRSDARILKAFEQVNKLFEDLEVVGKCKAIKSTYKHLPSFIFTFEITKVLKGKFEKKEISFEIGYFSSQNKAGKIEDDLRKDNVPKTLENQWDFDSEKEVILRFIQPVSGEDSRPRLVNWEIIKK